MTQDNQEVLKWQKRFERERASRKEAEKLLEEKSAEIYELNLKLEQRVQDEVLKNEEKQRILFQQSKMAAMGEMISNIAHQWRQPLHAVKLISQKIKLNRILGLEVDDELIDSVEKDINRQIDYLNNTIEDFRNFFRPNKEKETFNIDETINTTLNIVRATLKQKEIEVIIDSDKDLNTFNLKNELMQVIINLIKNAIDILEEKDLKTKLIILKVYKDHNNSNEIIIDVLDNAGGIKDEIMGKILEPYFTTKHQSKGTGLGLYMSHEIITKHMNGEFIILNEEYEYKNNHYKGALFRIVLKK